MANGDSADAAAARRAAVRRPQAVTGQMPGGTVLPTGAVAQAAAAKSAKASQTKRLAVAGAAGAVGFFLGGPIGAALGAAGGYGFMYVKEYGIGISK